MTEREQPSRCELHDQALLPEGPDGALRCWTCEDLAIRARMAKRAERTDVGVDEPVAENDVITIAVALARADRHAPPHDPSGKSLLFLARASTAQAQEDEDLKTAAALGVLAAEVRRLQDDWRLSVEARGAQAGRLVAACYEADQRESNRGLIYVDTIRAVLRGES